MHSLDAILLVPFDPPDAVLLDPATRRSLGAHFTVPLLRAVTEASDYVGIPLVGYVPAVSDGEPLPREMHRTLSAVALATVLERAGLRWRVFDPGERSLSWWRQRLEEVAPLHPPFVGICSTFVTSGNWLRLLIALVRRILPDAKLVVGGYYYSTDTRDFLKLDADALCIGEGEQRLPEIVRAVLDGRPLDGIRGLYLRCADGRLTFTGHAEPLDIAKRCRPDYRLAARIEPRIDVQNEFVDVSVETQRGCVFKCEFCTYRTLSSPNLMGPDDAVDRIMDAAAVRRGAIFLIDATGTFPRERWRQLLNRLIARGGPPHPVTAFARVSDIDDVTAELMARARIAHVFIGQESGDQRMLDLIRKGTKVSQVAPAMRALARHGIRATLGLLYGFPGETDASIANTRRLLKTINDDCKDDPVVLCYKLLPFHFQDFAAVTQNKTRHQDPGSEYGSRGYDIERSSLEVFRTLSELSRIPHAPASGGTMRQYAYSEMLAGKHRREIHRTMKLLDRTIAAFLDHRLFNVPIDRVELAELRRQLLVQQRPMRPLARATLRVARGVGGPLLEKLRSEWQNDDAAAGSLTRTLVAAKMWSELRTLEDAAAGYAIATSAASAAPAPEVVENAAAHADALIRRATELGRIAKLPKDRGLRPAETES